MRGAAVKERETAKWDGLEVNGRSLEMSSSRPPFLLLLLMSDAAVVIN